MDKTRVRYHTKRWGLFLWDSHTVLAWSIRFWPLARNLSIPCFAQELEPRRWSHLPTAKNFVGGGYSYSKADICFDPVLRIEDVEMEMHTWAFKYIRTFELLQKSARVDFIQGDQEAFPVPSNEVVCQILSCDLR